MGKIGGQAGAWQGHMAAGHLHSSHTGCIYNIAHHPIWQSSRWGRRGRLHNLTSSSSCRRIFSFSMLHCWALKFIWLVNMHSFIAPLCSGCPPEAKLSSSCTALGRRCNLYCCVEFIPGFHHSQSPFCPLLLAGPPQSIPPVTLQLSPTRMRSPGEKIPRLQHWLRCRRGSARARPSSRCRSPSSHSNSSASDSPRSASPQASNRCRTNRGQIGRAHV